MTTEDPIVPDVRPDGAPTSEEIAAVKALTEKNRAIDADPEGNKPDEPKPEKTPEERERHRMQRAIDRKTRQVAESRAEALHARQELERLTARPIANNNRASADDSEPISLTRAQIRELVNAEAARLAPTITEHATEVQRRQGVVEGLAKTLGKERFDEVASDLDEAFGGLADGHGRPKPATEAIFEADDPAKVIEFLADPENLEEAERIARLGPVQAGKAIAKLEAQLKALPAKDKPRPSTAPAPLEPVRGQGAGKEKRLADLSGKEFAERRLRQIAQRH